MATAAVACSAAMDCLKVVAVVVCWPNCMHAMQHPTAANQLQLLAANQLQSLAANQLQLLAANQLQSLAVHQLQLLAANQLLLAVAVKLQLLLLQLLAVVAK